MIKIKIARFHLGASVSIIRRKVQNLRRYDLVIKHSVRMTVPRRSRWSRDCRYTSKFNIYIIIAFVPGSVLDTTLCHRQICRELKFPPFLREALFAISQIGFRRHSASRADCFPRFAIYRAKKRIHLHIDEKPRARARARFTFAPNKYVYCLPEGAYARYNRLGNGSGRATFAFYD